MNTQKLKIKFSIGYFLIWILFLLYFFHRFLIENGVPDFAKYLLDVLNVIIFIYALSRKSLKNRAITYLRICYGIMLVVGTIALFLNLWIWKIDFLYYFFDCRLLLRLPIFFYSCSKILKKKDVENLFTWILKFHIINSIYIIYQYFMLDVPMYWMRGDNLNGFFGTATGGNIYVNVLLIVTTIIVLNKYNERKISKKKLGIYIGLNLIIAVLIELKMFFVEFVVIFVIFILPYIKKPKISQIKVAIISIILAIPVGMGLINLFYKIYPWMEGTLSVFALIKYASSNKGYTSSGDINRLTVISDVVKLIYNGNWIDSLFGVGLGIASANGENGQFFQNFSSTHYSWISAAYIFIELGALGLIIYIISIMVPLFCGQKQEEYYFVTKTICIISLLLLIYNESLKTEAGYIIFFMMSTNFIRTNREKANELQNTV